MNLVELFQRLSLPENDSVKTLNAIPIPECPNLRIAVDIDGYPLLLLPAFGTSNISTLRNRRLKYLQFEPKVDCKISEGNSTSFQQFSLITFESSDKVLQEYFLRISETFIKSMQSKETYRDAVETLNRYIEVFRALSDPPTNTAQGLWAEIFLIEYSGNPKILLSYWHNFPEEKFDFDAGEEKIEVKSTSGFERIHEFSSEQLNPSPSNQVLIASLFTRQTNSGKSIQELMQAIASKIQDDNELVEKLNSVVGKTLGSTLDQSIRIKFDYQAAKSSLRFYKHQDISKVEKVYIPTEVSGVRYKSDLSSIKSVDLSNFITKASLFRGIVN
jgi:hypothetical protein